jgi:hypothetical protein
MHCATVQAVVTIEVTTGTYVGFYDLIKVSVSP